MTRKNQVTNLPVPSVSLSVYLAQIKIPDVRRRRRIYAC